MGVTGVHGLQCTHLKRSLLQTKTFFPHFIKFLIFRGRSASENTRDYHEGVKQTKHRSDLHRKKKGIKMLYSESYNQLLLQEAWTGASSLFPLWYDYMATKSFGSVNLLYIMINLYIAENPRSSALFLSWAFLPNVKAENSFNKNWGHFRVLCNASVLACVGQQEEMLSRHKNT